MKEATIILISNAIFDAIETSPKPGAVIVCEDKIEAVVSKDEAKKYCGVNTKVYELDDQLVCPGFVDNHVFFTGYVWSHIGADLSSATSTLEAIEILKSYMETNPDKTTILGHGLAGDVLETVEEEQWKDFGDKAVIGFTVDRDGCIINSAAREKFGLSEDEVYAEACYRVFDEYLRDRDFILTEYEKFSNLLAMQGVTAIKEIGFDRYSGFYNLLKDMEKEGCMKHRINLVSQPVGAPMDFDYASECQQMFTGDWIQFMGFNVMVDGEIAAHNADMVDEYADLPGSHGEQEIDYVGLENAVLEADARGIRCALHAEGDAAVRKTIDIYEKCRKVNGDRDARHIITDLEKVRKEDLERMAKLGITACNYVQIMDCLGDFSDFYGYDRVGEEGIKDYWPYQNMFKAGVHMACGTDLPLTIPDIPLSCKLTISRTFGDSRPEGGINKECALRVDQILKAWTIEGQYANFKEKELGTLEAGKYADIAVIDSNLFDMDPMEMPNAKVSMTLCNGKIVYEA